MYYIELFIDGEWRVVKDSHGFIERFHNYSSAETVLQHRGVAVAPDSARIIKHYIPHNSKEIPS